MISVKRSIWNYLSVWKNRVNSLSPNRPVPGHRPRNRSSLFFLSIFPQTRLCQARNAGSSAAAQHLLIRSLRPSPAAVPVPEQGQGHADVKGKALHAEAAGECGEDLRSPGRCHGDRLGQPDPFLCAPALSLFWNWDRSFWHCTTIPVGIWVIRTAW